MTKSSNDLFDVPKMKNKNSTISLIVDKHPKRTHSNPEKSLQIATSKVTESVYRKTLEHHGFLEINSLPENHFSRVVSGRS